MRVPYLHPDLRSFCRHEAYRALATMEALLDPYGEVADAASRHFASAEWRRLVERAAVLGPSAPEWVELPERAANATRASHGAITQWTDDGAPEETRQS